MVVLIHGIGHSADIFYRNIDVLAQTHRVIAVDLPGHGFSDHIPLAGRTPQTLFAEHLTALIDGETDARYTVVGSSYGGLIASLMTLSSPERVGKLVIVGSGGTFQEPDKQRTALLKILENASGAMAAPTLESCRTRIANICADPASVAEEILLTQLISYALPDRFAAFKEILAAYIDSLASGEGQARPRLEMISVPTLIITGRNDIRATVESHEAGNRRIPDSRLVVLEACGHVPYMEHPQEFHSEMAAFLAS
ncbi:alpha/beta hydrolase [Acuticoccus sp. 2012]|uniref:Alpha/beta hydrolase n=1 Tax=Acuticoccus mangrovi TaxID=2796142 RepID=A0A934MJS5_9HYPH|nr:alpha/beta hydrolase [Acuticoccus mangrovi]MBJ3778616.1 alpha/beta hydrolase [Acuticoccus mangrovi]